MVGLNEGLYMFCCPYHQSNDCKVNKRNKQKTPYNNSALATIYLFINMCQVQDTKRRSQNAI